MNKSKFLKKSLAAFLAILMVAAMIPLSAAAAGTALNGNDIITVVKGTLSGSEFDWNVELPYNSDGTETITVDVKRDCTIVLAGEDVENATDTGSKKAIIDVADVKVGAPKSYVVVARTIDEEDNATDEVYNFTVSMPAASHVADVLTATYTVEAVVGTTPAYVSTGDIVGNTITFTVPWGKVPANNGTPTVKYTMTDAPIGFTGEVNSSAIKDGVGQITVTAQGGDTANYTVKFVEEEALAGLSIAGVAAEKDLKADPTGKTWDVTVVKDDLTDKTPVEVEASKFVKEVGFDDTDGTTVLTDRTADLSSLTFTTDNTETYKLTIKDRDGFITDAYTVKMHLVLDTETGIEGVEYQEMDAPAAPPAGPTGRAGDTPSFKEIGTMVGNALNVSLRAGITDAELANDYVTIKTTSKKVKSLTCTSGTVDNTDKANGNWKITNPSLGTSVIVVTAEDGKTTATYTLNITKATATQSAPAVTAGTMYLNKGAADEVKMEGTVKNTATEKSITFEVPAIVTETVVNTELAKGTGNISFDWALTPYTKAGDFTSNSDTLYKKTGTETPDVVGNYTKYGSYFETTEKLYVIDENSFTSPGDTTIALMNKIVLTPDAGATQDWKIILKMKNANVGHSLTSLTFYGTDKEKKVTEENTFKTTVRPTGITMDTAVPWGYANDTTKADMTFDFVASTGATVYTAVEAGTLTKVTGSGWDENGDDKYSIKADQLKLVKNIVVISELGFTRTDSPIAANVSTLSAVKDDAAVTVYPFTYNEESISAQKDILSLESTNGMVTSVIEGNTVKLIVPTTYVEKDKETYFDLAVKLSDFASLKKADGTTAEDAFNAKGVFVNAQVKGNDTDGYKLMGGGAQVGPSWVVVAQDGSKKPYTLSIEVADLDDDNTLNGITVKDVAAEEGEDGWTVELPYGTDLEELTTDDIVADVAESADVTVTKNEDGTYTITVTAENGQKAEYTLTVTVADKPDTPTPVEFEDVKDTDWFAKVVGKAAANKWIMGTNGKFNPYGDMKRGDFALIIARIQVEDFDNNCEEFKTDIYTDVTSESYWNEAIGYVTEKGIMGGRGNGIFDPNGTITREEAAKVMCLAKGLDPAEGNTTFTDDASIAGWAKPFVKACQEAGIVNGSNGKFDPKGKLNRAQGANMLVNAFDVEEAE